MTTLESQLNCRATWDERASAILRYAYSCRNREKRAYAIHYGGWVLGMAREPAWDAYDLSYMGSQAVRLQITAL